MPVEYDLIVIGASPEGIYAALVANSFNARVALVGKPVAHQEINNLSLTRVANLYHQYTPEFGVDYLGTSLNLAEVRSGTKLILSAIAQGDSLARLGNLGVDIVIAQSEFSRFPDLALITKDRRLRARSYLIATGCVSRIPYKLGLEEIGYLTPLSLWTDDNLLSFPENLIVAGGTPSALELAQSFARLGKNVTMLVEHKSILPQEDPEVSLSIQAQLEAEGVKIMTLAPVIQVKEIEGKKWVQAGTQALESDEIVMAKVGEPNVEGLNLEGVGVQLGKDGILINEKMQTTNQNIYACGDVVGGYPLSHIACYEADIAVKNALFVPLFKVDYNSVPWVIFTDPQVARVGMTATQAGRYYGKEVRVVREYFKNLPLAQFLTKTSGFCQFVIGSHDEILGASIVGSRAGELIGALSLAIRQKIKLDKLLCFPDLTLSQIIPQAVFSWQSDCRKRNRTWQNLLANLFIWRRNWTK